MNKNIFKLAIFAFSSALVMSGCSLASYTRSEPTIEVSDSFIALKESYVNDLNNKYYEDMYYAVEALEFEKTLVESINRINESNSEEKANEAYFEACYLLNQIKTIQDYIDEETKAFNDYKDAAVNIIINFVNVSDYRETEQGIILEKLESFTSQIRACSTYEEVDEQVRRYKTEVYALLTDQEYYAQELASLKVELGKALETIVNISLYREAESTQIAELILAGKKAINSVSSKEAANSTFDEYRQSILAIKTDDELTQIELLKCANHYLSLLETKLISSGLSSSYYEDGEGILEEAKNVLPGQESQEDIVDKYIEYLKLIFTDATNDSIDAGINGYRNACVEQINLSVNFDEYETDKKEVLVSAIQNATETLASQSLIEDFEGTTNELLQFIISIPKKGTSFVAKFRSDLKEMFGDNILKEPACGLERASNLYELADIVDYYCFYQISDTQFLCSVVVVELDFKFPSNPNDFFDFYPYLLARCVDYTYFLSKNTITIRLKAMPFVNYNHCNVEKNFNIYITHNGGHTNKRSDDFDDFKYKENEDTISCIWNDQQLYYALKNGYNVECVEGSIAETALNNAKNILREKVNDDMNIDEKVFNISSWFGSKLISIWKFYGTFPLNDIARRASSVLEGHPGTCTSVSKAFVILTSIEGITSDLTTPEPSEFHTDCLFKSNNGKHYISGPHFAFDGFATTDIAYSYSVISTQNSDFFAFASAKRTMDVVESDDISEMYNHLRFHDAKVFVRTIAEVDDLVNTFRENDSEVATIIFERTSVGLINHFKDNDDFEILDVTPTRCVNYQLVECCFKR